MLQLYGMIQTAKSDSDSLDRPGQHPNVFKAYVFICFRTNN